MVLEVKDLSVGIKGGKEYLFAVREISFGVEEGEIVGILGESGCGKTLTALSVSGLLPEGVEKTGGSIRFGGRDLGALPEGELSHIRGRELSMVFQEPASSLNPLQRVGTQVGESLKLHGEGDPGIIRRRVLEILGNLGLPEPEQLVRAYPHQLSGGMCQRVMIALAVINRPRLLIADEPTTALDLSIQTQILDLMRKINRELGTSILFISHDLSVIRHLCDRVLVMYAGKIVESGPAEEVFRKPLHEYTRLLLGAIPSRDRKGRALANIPGKVPALGEIPPGCPFAPRCKKVLPRCREGFPEGAVWPAALPADWPSSGPAIPSSAFAGGHRVFCLLADLQKEPDHGGI
ncbi:MAG: ABC transporter ATP-binding protein [Treponema sp.]|jgi:peptide/nickel transport system ATP-binding protein|nr:ABC transporter ATP-binding protein [Treponema sp.]